MRKSHRKSRHGCAECKRRRVKCDEVRPTCTNCRRRASTCFYSSSDSYMWLNDDSVPYAASHTVSFSQDLRTLFSRAVNSANSHSQHSEIDGPLSSPTFLNLSNLELIILWVNKTYLSFTREETREIWQFLVPQEALSHKFLMHGLLAMSALQEASSSDYAARMKYINTAVKHQNQALAEFQQVLGQINYQNAKAIFAFSSVLVVYSFGFLHIEKPDESPFSLEDLYQIFMLCRGVQQIIARSSSSIHDSNFSPILDHRPVAYPFLLPSNVQLAIYKLRETNTSFGTQSPNHDVSLYQEAITRVEEALNASYQDKIPQNVASRWAIKLPSAFLNRVKDREPMALVIVGFFCVVLHRLRSLWYFRGWGTTVMKLIWQSLQPPWQQLVHWAAIEVLGEGLGSK